MKQTLERLQIKRIYLNDHKLIDGFWKVCCANCLVVSLIYVWTVLHPRQPKSAFLSQAKPGGLSFEDEDGGKDLATGTWTKHGCCGWLTLYQQWPFLYIFEWVQKQEAFNCLGWGLQAKHNKTLFSWPMKYYQVWLCQWDWLGSPTWSESWGQGPDYYS